MSSFEGVTFINFDEIVALSFHYLVNIKVLKNNKRFSLHLAKRWKILTYTLDRLALILVWIEADETRRAT